MDLNIYLNLNILQMREKVVSFVKNALVQQKVGSIMFATSGLSTGLTIQKNIKLFRTTKLVRVFFGSFLEVAH